MFPQIFIINIIIITIIIWLAWNADADLSVLQLSQILLGIIDDISWPVLAIFLTPCDNCIRNIVYIDAYSFNHAIIVALEVSNYLLYDVPYCLAK